MPDIDDILKANRCFYDAFSTANVAAMEDIWSTQKTITCIHPGWPPLCTRDEVLSSWSNILSTQAVFVGVSNEEVRILGDTAYVICHEHLEPGTLIATNIFSREDHRWRLIHHQAGLTVSHTSEAFAETHPTIQ